jgi:hypothetical protein
LALRDNAWVGTPDMVADHWQAREEGCSWQGSLVPWNCVRLFLQALIIQAPRRLGATMTPWFPYIADSIHVGSVMLATQE